MLLLFYILAIVLSLASSTLATGLLIPLYSWPGTDAWSTIYDSIAAHPSVPFYLIINPYTGPGLTKYPAEAFITAIANLNSYPNTQVLGYTHTLYGTRARTDVEADIAVYAHWATYADHNISLSGIFFDEVPNGENGSKLVYFQRLSQVSKKSGLHTVVLNPGVGIGADAESWFAAAEFVVECEDTYANWVASAPTEHFSGEKNYGKDAVILNRTPEDADIGTVVRLAKSLGLGAIYLTHDDNYMSLASVPKVALAVVQVERVRIEVIK